jgi:uncharacterized protein RhaS with RHS repeats
VKLTALRAALAATFVLSFSVAPADSAHAISYTVRSYYTASSASSCGIGGYWQAGRLNWSHYSSSNSRCYYNINSTTLTRDRNLRDSYDVYQSGVDYVGNNQLHKPTRTIGNWDLETFYLYSGSGCTGSPTTWSGATTLITTSTQMLSIKRSGQSCA